MIRQIIAHLDATDLRDLVAIVLFVCTGIVWAAIGAGA
jgi:hypothetical protein